MDRHFIRMFPTFGCVKMALSFVWVAEKRKWLDLNHFHFKENQAPPCVAAERSPSVAADFKSPEQSRIIAPKKEARPEWLSSSGSNRRNVRK